MKKAKILIYDIENTPHEAYVWGKIKQNVIKFKKTREVLCYSYKWLGDKKVHYERQYGGGDKKILTKLAKLMLQADMIITHNGDQHDNGICRGRMLHHKLLPNKPITSMDTCKVAQSQFNFPSNSLNDLAEFLELGNKYPNPGFSMWLGCMEGDKASWAEMKKYNIQDTLLLEKVYLRMRPWIKNHPRLSQLYGEYNCPNCESKHVQKRGERVTTKSRFQRYQCQDCGAWFDETMKKQVG